MLKIINEPRGVVKGDFEVKKSFFSDFSIVFFSEMKLISYLLFVCLLFCAGSKRECLCDIFPCWRCLACHPVGKQCSCRWQDIENLSRNNQVLQPLFTEPTMHKKCKLTCVHPHVLHFFLRVGGGVTN